MTNELTCELVTDFARLEALAPQWERLHAAAAPSGGIFQSWGWTRAYWRTHGHDRSLCTVAAFAGDRLVGILPLALDGHTAHLLGAPYSDYNGLLCLPRLEGAVAPAVMMTLMAAPVPWSECVLEGVPESSPLLRERAQMPPALRARWQILFGSLCPAALDETGDVFDRLSRKESLRRHEKRLARRGDLRFRHIEERTEILAHLDTFIRLHVARHAEAGNRSSLVSPAARHMLAALVEELDPRRELRFSVLEIEHRPIAYHLGFQHDGRFTYYMPAFDLDFHHDGPGEVMLRRLLQYAHEQRLQEFDFTIGDEGYKRRFATHVRRTFTIYFYRHPHRVAVEARRLARAVRDAARRRAAIVACARPVIRAVRRFSEHLHP